MATLSVIRRWALREQLSIREIARRTGLSRNTIKKYLRAGEAEPRYAKRTSPSKLDPFAEKLSGWLKSEASKSRKQRRTLKQMHADLVALGFEGSYNRVAAFARAWAARRQEIEQTTGRGTFVPLTFGAGEAFQFDWSEDWAILGGERTKLQVAHFKLSHSRAFLLRAYPLQTHEMLFDAHNHAFEVLGGVPRRGIYDNMKTAVDKVRRGKERDINARFQAMVSHFLFEAEFCNPASGWEKGQVEKNVRDARHRLWQPTPVFTSLDALNDWLEQRCQALWSEITHGKLPGTVADVWAQERSFLMPRPRSFDGFVEHTKRVSESSCTRPDQLGAAMTSGLLSGLAVLLQYLVPLFCVVAAAVSMARRAKRSGLVTNVTTNGAAAALEGMTWPDFELLVGEAFRLQGFQVEERGGAAADGGVDVVLRRDGETFLVQCKHWKSLQVSVQVVRELFGVMASQGAAGGYVVTSGTYTAPAKEFASGRNIQLIDGARLASMLRQARSARRSEPTEERPKAPSGRPAQVLSEASHACPVCSSGMVTKRAKRGPNAGGLFLSCKRYPECTGTRPLVG